MFHAPITIAPARIAGLLEAATSAARAIPPAFPLTATVAVNPFLGQTDEDLATAAARLERVAGARLTRPRPAVASDVLAGKISDDDLATALLASRAPLKPRDLALLKAKLATDAPPPKSLPTVADLAARATGTDWPDLIERSFGLWAAAYFDLGQAFWTPAPRQGALAAWRDWAAHDLSPEIAGLHGFCASVAASPDNAQGVILRAAETLQITEAAAPTLFHRLYMEMGGWAQHARWLLWEAERKGSSDTTLLDLLAIRLIWEEALLQHAPQVTAKWAETRAGHTAPVAPTADHVLDAILQDASERAHQRWLSGQVARPKAETGRPLLQAAFCIDVRSEVFRRALETVDPRIATIGFAGFFGLPLAHRAHGSAEVTAHLPVLLAPSLTSSNQASPAVEDATRIVARATRAWGRFRQAAVSSFAFVEAAGPVYGMKLMKDALGRHEKTQPTPAPRFDTAWSPEAKAATAAAILKAMSMTTGHARLVLLLGHGATARNNPHESAYHCGACGGQTGEVSARLLATLLNDPETRAGLATHGLALPADTVFLAGLHDTTTDHITLHEDGLGADHAADLQAAQKMLARAAELARAERAFRLPGATAQTVARRAHDWAEVRPEWGLAGCSAFIAAPRAITAGSDLQGRAFLHSYDWQTDTDFSTLNLILTAPVVVASWISLQYYASTVAPETFGGGNKLLHNVVGGIGVVQGNGGMLRAGLPWQSVHDGTQPVHDPLRLSVLIEAPTAAMSDILARHNELRHLFDNGWLHLLALEDGKIIARYRPGLVWEPERPAALAEEAPRTLPFVA